MLSFDLSVQARYSDKNFKNYVVDFEFDQDDILYSDDIIDEMESELEITIEDVENIQYEILDTTFPVDILDTYNAESYDDIIDRINDIKVFDREDLINMYYDGDPDAMPYPMSELDDKLEGYTPTYIIEKALYGDFSTNDDYFIFDSYDNLVSLTEKEKQENEDYYIEEVIKDRF